MSRLARIRRRFFPTRLAAPGSPFDYQARAFERSRMVVQVYYVGLFFLVLGRGGRFEYLLSEPAPDLLWPVRWLAWVEHPYGVAAILVAVGLGSLAAMVWPDRRSARALAFAGLLPFHALLNSYGRIGHSWHVWVMTSALLVALPRPAATKPRAGRRSYALVVWAAQALLLLTYSLAGLGKVLGAFRQIAAGGPHAFAPDALARHVADRLLETGSESLLGPWAIDHELLVWPGFLLTLYVQLFAVAAAFRPELQRPFAVVLILFHVGTYLTMEIRFFPNCLLLGILLLASPFPPAAGSWREAAAGLPVVGRVLGLALRGRSP